MCSMPILSTFYLPSHRCKEKSCFRVKKLVKTNLVFTTTFAKETEFPEAKEYATSRERAFCSFCSGCMWSPWGAWGQVFGEPEPDKEGEWKFSISFVICTPGRMR